MNYRMMKTEGPTINYVTVLREGGSGSKLYYGRLQGGGGLYTGHVTCSFQRLVNEWGL